MKKLITALLFLLLGPNHYSQQNLEETAVLETLKTFLEGFHEQDSLKIRSVVADSINLQTIGKNMEGKTIVYNMKFQDFLESIVTIPSKYSFKEVLHSFNVRVDGDLANVWTPYSFYFNGELSHCGANSFQLYKEAGEWKVFYLVDTRRREGCIPGPEKWEEVIDLFEGGDVFDMPEPGVILFTGSSSIAMWKDLEKAFPGYEVLNRGFGGSEFSDLLYYTDRIVYPYQPSKIFIYEGDNDLAAGESIESILREARRLREEIRAELPNTSVIFISPKPSLSRWNLKEKYEALNEALEQYAGEAELTEFADVWTAMLDKKGKLREDLFLEDDLHMNEKGYEIWKKVLQPFLED